MQRAHKLVRRIADSLVARAIWSGSRCTWVDRTRTRGATYVSVRPLGGDLYSGTAGIALFLAALHLLDPDPQLRRTALGAIANSLSVSLVANQENLSFYGGRGGVAATALLCADWLAEPELRKYASQMVIAARPSHTHSMDLIGGDAGAVLSAFLCHSITRESSLKEVISRYADAIVSARDPRVRVTGWNGSKRMTRLGSRTLTGMSHGVSGLAIALGLAWSQSRDPLLRQVARDAIAYEDRYYCTIRENWQDLRENQCTNGAEQFMYAWCHGAPGVLLARVFLARIGLLTLDSRTSGLVGGMGRRLRRMAATPSDFSLCHGLAGVAEIVSLCAEMTNNAPLRAEVLAQWDAVLSNQQLTEDVASVQPHVGPTLMLGAAGIGYAVIRLLRPDLPSPLLPVFGAANPGLLT